jgi:hypothetical protein
MRWLFVAMLSSALGTLACGDSPTSPSGANFRVMLTDGPFSDAKSVLVTFSEITVHRRGEGNFTPLTLEGGQRMCDLKKLQNAQEVLGVGTLAAGHYTQVRLVVSDATIHFDNAAVGNACAPAIGAPEGNKAPVEIPSGEIRLNREFDVPATGMTTMLLDFDGDRSIVQTGNGRYLMTPVVAVASVH